jgi:hypothetical protein
LNDLSQTALLDAWERGRAQPLPGERGLLLLGLAHPDVADDVRGAWSVGRRDAALLAFHQRTFGPMLAGVTPCQACGDLLELQAAVDDVFIGSQEPGDVLSLSEDGYRLAVRLPSAEDMAALARGQGGNAPERWLLERCVVDARRHGAACRSSELPNGVLAAVASAIAAADPQADIELSVICPMCGHPSTVLFDIVSFLWREVDAWATEVLREICTLASAFGWSEQEILDLPPWRRRWYVEVAGG